MELPSIFVYTHDSVGARRGRPDPPADRAPGRAAGDPRPGDDPARRRQRGRGRLAGGARRHRRARPRSSSRRQGLPTLARAACPVERGAYVLEDGGDCDPDRHRLRGAASRSRRAAAGGRRLSARVVSMPSLELFRAQDAATATRCCRRRSPRGSRWRRRARSAGPSGSARAARWSASTASGPRRPATGGAGGGRDHRRADADAAKAAGGPMSGRSLTLDSTVQVGR